jgi:hypothetical protein
MQLRIYLLLLLYVIIATLTIVFFNGTGDAGDSISHYLFARYAPVHPELYFNHWAKPVYVLLASPFAQFGFTGVKVFNALITLTTIFVTSRIVLLLNIQNAFVTAIILIFTPLYYILTFSGLTEPLFALALAAGLYFAVKDMHITAAIIISFLPYIRSEGLIIIGVFLLYFLFKKQLKVQPWLLTGSVVYSIAGYFVHHDFLWVFTQIPYATLNSAYGSGDLSHFITALLYVVGVPIYILLWLGIISILRTAIFKKVVPEIHIIIFLGFTFFLIAHSLFWYLGIFNSMGLGRVLLCTIPLTALIATSGFNFLTEELLKRNRKAKTVLQAILIVYIVIFPFTSNPAAIKWERNMMLTTDQLLANKTAEFIWQKKGKDFRIITAHPYIYEALQIDCFDQNKALGLNENNIANMKAGDILIWDSWFAVVESKVKKETLDTNPELKNTFFTKAEDRKREISFAVYEK